MDILSASILSGLIYDGVKGGAVIGFDLLKSKLQGWLIDDSQIEKISGYLKDAGVNEDLAPHAIERKITEHHRLLDLISNVKASGDSIIVEQTSNIGHNINSTGSGNISVGNIEAGKDK